MVIGYRAGPEGVRRLLVATMREEGLRYVGELRSGWSPQARLALARRLASQRRTRPLVSCPQAAYWVEPELYCRVRFRGWTRHGCLRNAVFGGWILDAG